LKIDNANKKGSERVPLERHEKVRMKKCHGRSCRTAGQTGVTGQRMKQTDRHGNFRASHVAARASPPEKQLAKAVRDWSRLEQWPAKDLHGLVS